MDKNAALQITRNCLTVLGAVNIPLRFYEKAMGVDVDSYIWIAVFVICLLVGVLWTMNEREKALKKEAEERFFQTYPEHKDYKYFWELYSLYHHGKSLPDNGISDPRFIEWRLEIKHCLKEWGETKNRDFGLNLPPHATVNDYLKKLEDTLSEHSKTIRI